MRNQFESQALDSFGTGLLPPGVSPIQNVVVTILVCQKNLPGIVSLRLRWMPPGSNLKSTSSRSFIALSTKLVGVSAPPCAVVWEFEVTTKPKKICKNSPGVLMTGTKMFANLLRANGLSTGTPHRRERRERRELNAPWHR